MVPGMDHPHKGNTQIASWIRGHTHTELDILGAFFAIALAVTPGLGEKLGTPTVQLARSFLEEMLRGSNFAKWNPNYQKTL